MSIDTILSKLGYHDNSEVFPTPEKVTVKLLYKFDSGSIIISPFAIQYPNKKSYLNVEYEYYYDEPEEVIESKIKSLIEIIKYPSPGKVLDVGWDAEYLVDPRVFTKKERAKIAISSYKKFKYFLKNGMPNVILEENDILVARALGIKFDKGFNQESELEGSSQRERIATKILGFGTLKDDGLQYAMYDKDLNIIPI